MSMFHVDSHEVARCSQVVRASAETIRAEVNAMMGHLTALEASWSGVAASQFSEVAASWRVTQQQVETALDTISAQLAAAASTYEDAESQATSLFAAAR